MSNEECVKFVRKRLLKRGASTCLSAICEEVSLRQEALQTRHCYKLVLDWVPLFKCRRGLCLDVLELDLHEME